MGMFCGNCGTKLEDNERFCPNCGAAADTAPSASVNTGGETGQWAEAEASTIGVAAGVAAPQAAKPNKKLITGAGIVVAVIVIAVIIASAFGGGSPFGFISDGSILFQYSEATEETACIAGGKIVASFDGYASSTAYSLDRSAAAVLSSDETLYAVTGKGMAKVSDDVYDFVISNDGTGIAYITDYDYYESSGALYLYNVKSASSEKIASAALYPAISPDGKTVAYIGDIDGDDSFKGYVSVNGKTPELIKSNVLPMAVADGGKYLYYCKMESLFYYAGSGDLYVKKGGNETKLASGYYLYSTACFNKDYSQILYSSDDKTYISVNGGEKTKLFNEGSFSLVYPANASVKYSFSGSVAHVYDIDGFAQKTVVASNGIYYIDKGYEASRVTSSYYYYFISDDGNTLLYTKSGKLYKVDDLKKSTDGKAITGGDEIYSFTADSSCAKIYYLNYDDELYYQKGSSAAKKIADDVESFTLGGDGSTLYFVSDEILYMSKNGGTKASVSGNHDVVRVTRFGTGIAYYAESDNYSGCYDLYYAKSGGSFDLVLEGVTSIYGY